MIDYAESIIRDCENDEVRAADFGEQVAREAADLIEHKCFGEIADQLNRDQVIDLVEAVYMANQFLLTKVRADIYQAAWMAAEKNLEGAL